MFEKIKAFFTLEPTKSELEEYILSKNPSSIQDIEYWTRMYDIRPRFITHRLLPQVGVFNGR